MRTVGKQHSDEEYSCLPRCAWLFLAVAFMPHFLMLAGQEFMASVASCACFPGTMGPFALAHTYLLVSRLGFVSHMAWISALTFSMIWFGFLNWLWRKNRTVTLAIGSLCFIMFGEWTWAGFLSQA